MNTRTSRHLALRTGTVDDLDLLGEIDNDAGTLFEEAGMFLDLPADHEFPAAERRRWRACLAARTTLIAMDPAHGSIGFAAIGRKDRGVYLAQLSVRRRFMGLGIGSALLESTAELADALGAKEFWLTTYDHLRWNRPFYERHGFVVMPEAACGAELLEEHRIEKRWLPLPEQRVLMRRMLSGS